MSPPFGSSAISPPLNILNLEKQTSEGIVGEVVALVFGLVGDAKVGKPVLEASDLRKVRHARKLGLIFRRTYDAQIKKRFVLPVWHRVAGAWCLHVSRHWA
ncbi:hypothetical protein ACMD2_16872 [Ananas comosus]|uniref:Uncharacterized protein n=1 Tax=Ananas comosus TaxID=4615 RepID=A0A199US08_ANACO|nr:hypothetical protein ACMD2_16872 [Ananas comosus]